MRSTGASARPVPCTMRPSRGAWPAVFGRVPTSWRACHRGREVRSYHCCWRPRCSRPSISKWRQMGCSDMRSDQFPMDVPDSSTLARCVRSRLRGRCGEFTKDMNLIKDKGSRGTAPCDTVMEIGVAGGCELWAVGGLASALPSRVLGGGRGR